ncbi:MAG: alpha-D-ribose 1-methylphosphonate 5-triphosphate diphosphatase [Acetobacteraceae bacterium]|nr:alpha-D-ribose 1-methylphosphonate 5-triphosphate diphosphatase [Acetobacteraceae bacterium]
MSMEVILSNARIVLPDHVMHGSVAVRDRRIAAVEDGRSNLTTALDMDGDYLIPGVVDVHTDNLERQVQPRQNARWPSRSAMLAHDAQCAAAGVTSVLDALCLGDLGFNEDRVRTFHEAVVDLNALAGTGLFKAEHFLHLRCELPALDVLELFEPVADHPRVRMISLMDHCPGTGQYANLDYYRGLRRKDGHSEDYIERLIAKLQGQRARMRVPNRRAILARAAALDVTLASHDDRTEEEIAENHADGIGISEFPVTMLAAQAAKRAGMQVIAGAPNIVRGGSHSGNISASDLVKADAVDAFASDYVPASLVEAAFRCVTDGALDLASAIALITERPARMAHLHDRGHIAPGMRADLVRVRLYEGLPVVRQVWRAGERVI